MAEAILVKGGYSESNTKTISLDNVKIAVNAWKLDDSPTKSPDYPYTAPATIPGMTENYIPDVVFGITDAISGNYAPVCKSAADSVYIYAKEIPETEITLLTVKGTLQVQ